MKIIVDSNIVFSAFLNTQNTIGDILLNSQNVFEFFTCEYLREEINSHQGKIMELTGYDEAEYKEIQYQIYSQLHFFREAILPFEYWQEGAKLVRDVDINDVAFVALSLFLDAKLWSGDKALLQGLQQKGFVNGITTTELAAILRKENN